jgi:hypothetical protein
VGHASGTDKHSARADQMHIGTGECDVGPLAVASRWDEDSAIERGRAGCYCRIDLGADVAPSKEGRVENPIVDLRVEDAGNVLRTSRVLDFCCPDNKRAPLALDVVFRPMLDAKLILQHILVGRRAEKEREIERLQGRLRYRWNGDCEKHQVQSKSLHGYSFESYMYLQG